MVRSHIQPVRVRAPRPPVTGHVASPGGAQVGAVAEGGGFDPAVRGGDPEQVGAGGVDDRLAVGGVDGEVVAVGVVAYQHIAATLVDLDGRVVHRDLKPENVLLHGGHRCLADFGISRYAEATTAPDTRKYAMSPPYAAPEQWRFERAGTPADAYAFGVMAYELLSGSLPFTGPDFRDQHLNKVPEPLTAASNDLQGLAAALFHAADLQFLVELRGFEPLTLVVIRCST